jgi:exopolysaccharide biosynthesis WecB/TagA/CpsF family protein
LPIALSIDDCNLSDFSEIARVHSATHFDYVVTPNADHLIRYFDDPQFRTLYERASYVLLDSRFVANLIAVVKGQSIRVCRGSDLALEMLSKIVLAEDRIVLVGATPAQAQKLRAKYGLRHLAHINPPMGFIHDAAAVAACVSEIEANSPFRFCFLAIGSPQQEIVAERLKSRGLARGMALCAGASIDFITGGERRAPKWMQASGTEWVFRLIQNPRRLMRRYLVRGPRIFAVLPRIKLVLRPKPLSRAESRP